jgi:hypothetical protein
MNGQFESANETIARLTADRDNATLAYSKARQACNAWQRQHVYLRTLLVRWLDGYHNGMDVGSTARLKRDTESALKGGPK